MDSWPFSDKLSSTHETSPARVSSAKRKAGMSQLYSDSDSENEAADQSWLNVLPNHAIFQLQDDMRAEGHAYLPASPDLSAIGRDDASSEVSQVLSHTHLHVSSNSSPSCRQSIMAIVRDTELVVAVGQELRIASLAEVKAKASTASGSSSSPGTYKVSETRSGIAQTQQDDLQRSFRSSTLLCPSILTLSPSFLHQPTQSYSLSSVAQKLLSSFYRERNGTPYFPTRLNVVRLALANITMALVLQQSLR